MRLIPAGEFTMGSDNVDAALAACKNYDSTCDRGWFEDELVPHTVSLDAYYIDLYEVTNGRYAECVNAGVCQPPTETSSNTRSNYYGNSEFDNYPVIFIDWDMAKTYCEWRGARLPTEAEWEKAARGTDQRTYPWGGEASDAYGNYNNTIHDTNAVGSYESGKSPYGIYDMAGNVWEWTADYYSDTYYSSSPASNPQGPDSGQGRVLRGGSWYDPAFLIRTTTRLLQQYPVDNNYGFRCARSAKP
jgi:serine/threonine-protein kinase